MSTFAVLIEPVMSAAKFVTSRIDSDQMKVFVEFVPDGAALGCSAFQHCKSKVAMLNCRLDGIGVREQRRSVQIAPWKQQAQPLLGEGHAVDVKRRLDFSVSAEH